MSDVEPPAHSEPTLPSTRSAGTGGSEKKPPVDPSQSRALSNLPAELQTAISKTDELLLRLNKQIKTTAGLGSALGVLQYSLYIAAYLQTQSPSRAALIAYISRLIGRAPSKVAAVAPAAAAAGGASSVQALGSLVSDTRTTLRLTGLLPLAIWLKALLSKEGSKDTDPVLHQVALVQCVSYIVFQLYENIYHLVGKKVIPASFVEKRGGIMKFVVWSCRAWLLGVASDFARLWREAALQKDKRRTKGYVANATEEKEFDRQWWAGFVSAASWVPIAVQYSLYDGIPGMNMGIIGVCGAVASWNTFRNAWVATK